MNSNTNNNQNHQNELKSSETQIIESRCEKDVTVTCQTTTTTTANGVFKGDMTISKIITRCEEAAKLQFKSYRMDAKTACSESDKSAKIDWDHAKKRGEWVTCTNAYRVDTFDQNNDVGGYMCNPVNSKLIKIYRN
jgi:hypothetical protein